MMSKLVQVWPPIIPTLYYTTQHNTTQHTTPTAYLNLCGGPGHIIAGRGGGTGRLCEPALDEGLVEVGEGHGFGHRDVLGWRVGWGVQGGWVGGGKRDECKSEMVCNDGE